MLTGVLIDVSGSMRNKFDANEVKVNNNDISRGQTVFNTLFDILRDDIYNLNSNNYVFSLGFGLNSTQPKQHCDLISLFECQLSKFNTKSILTQRIRKYIEKDNIDEYIKQKSNEDDMFYMDSHEPLIAMAQKHGAPYCGDYIRRNLKVEESSFLFMQFYKNDDALKQMVKELPKACKTIVAHGGTKVLSKVVPPEFIDIATKLGFHAVASIDVTRIEKKAAENAKKRANELVLAPIYEFTEGKYKGVVHKREDIVKLMNKLNKFYMKHHDKHFDSKKLLNDIEPYIYGGTPMKQSLKHAQNIYNLNEYSNIEDKILLVISDGDSADGIPIDIANKIKKGNVLILCCFITNDDIKEPKRLYREQIDDWSAGARTMFEMSSEIDNNDSQLIILRNEGWLIPNKGKSKLFIQANHPNIIKQFCSIINKLYVSNDAIVNIISKYDWNVYINSKINNQKVATQKGGTCYANAVAMGLYLAMNRIYKRDGGVPTFDTLRNKIIKQHGWKGANTKSVLSQYCKEYRLRYKQYINEKDIKSALNKNRVLVARFGLYDEEWKNFSVFYKHKPKGILTLNDLKCNNIDKTKEKGGHAVLLIRYESKCLLFMNSWGETFADNGLFRIQNGNVLNLKFFDIFWYETDLSQNEKNKWKEYYEKKSTIIVNKYVIKKLLNHLEYKCPKCNKISNITEYNGSILKAVCPKCNKIFKPSGKGLLKCLYIKQTLINQNNHNKNDSNINNVTDQDIKVDEDDDKDDEKN